MIAQFRLLCLILPGLIAGSPQVTFEDDDYQHGAGHKGYDIGPQYSSGPIHYKPSKSISKEIAVAKAYNISDPVFSCPKPGYELIGEECVYVNTVDARFECPIGFTPIGGHHGHPEYCERRTPPIQTCPHGKLIHGVCHITTYTEPTGSCAEGTTPHGDGTCIRYEPVDYVEKCPEGSERVHGHCVEIVYTEPSYNCPPDTVQEGKKCRRELISYKTKGGKKNDGDAYLRRLEDMDDTDGLMLDTDNIEYDDMFSDLPAHVFTNDMLEGEAGCKGGKCEQPNSTWLPGVTTQTKPPKVIYTEGSKWQKIHVQVPVMVPQKNTPAPKQPKPQKVKVVKAPAPPQKIVKVQFIPAEKVCHKGDKHGGSCVTQVPVPSKLECPVPLIHHQCARKIITSADLTCKEGELVCPPHVHGNRCRCASHSETSPVITCPTGKLDPHDHMCVTTAKPKEYCPLGYFLDRNRVTCTKRDIEPALCMFSVTYMCPDCEKY